MVPMDVTFSISQLMYLPHTAAVGGERPQDPSSDAPHYHFVANVTAKHIK
jgi:hypothetical protein